MYPSLSKLALACVAVNPVSRLVPSFWQSSDTETWKHSDTETWKHSGTELNLKTFRYWNLKKNRYRSLKTLRYRYLKKRSEAETWKTFWYRYLINSQMKTLKAFKYRYQKTFRYRNLKKHQKTLNLCVSNAVQQNSCTVNQPYSKPAVQ